VENITIILHKLSSSCLPKFTQICKFKLYLQRNSKLSSLKNAELTERPSGPGMVKVLCLGRSGSPRAQVKR